MSIIVTAAEFSNRGLAASNTATEKFVVVVSCPSETLMDTSVVPACVPTGNKLKFRFAPLPPSKIPLFWSNFWLLEVAETIRLPTALSTSSTLKMTGPTGTPALVICLGMSEIVGASLTGVTPTLNDRVTLKLLLSVASMAIVFVPLWFKIGVIVRVRFAPLPLPAARD